MIVFDHPSRFAEARKTSCCQLGLDSSYAGFAMRGNIQVAKVPTSEYQRAVLRYLPRILPYLAGQVRYLKKGKTQ